MVIAAIGLYFLAVPPNVDVQGLNVYAPYNACGLNSYPIGYYGFNASAGTHQALELQLENFNTTGPCTVHNVTTNTSGFGVSDIQVPDTVGELGNGTINLTLSLPDAAYTGIVNLVFW